MNPTVETSSGQLVNLTNPTPESIDLRDIAWALSGLARFNAHTEYDRIWTVLDHSLLAMNIAKLKQYSAMTCLYALMHDFAEGYTGDIVSPLKNHPLIKCAIEPIEHGLMGCIYQVLKLPEPNSADLMNVKEIDVLCLSVESKSLMHSKGQSWGLPEACHEVQLCFESIFNDASDRKSKSNELLENLYHLLRQVREERQNHE